MWMIDKLVGVSWGSEQIYEITESKLLLNLNMKIESPILVRFAVDSLF